MNGRRLLGLKLRTAWALRPLNIARVLAYRLSLKLKLNRAVRRPPAAVTGPFFRAPDRLRLELAPRRGWYQWREAFGLRVDDGADMEAPPEWARSLVTGVAVPDTDRPWWRIADFDPRVGDIKGVWEASRYDWVLACAQQALAARDARERGRALDRLNAWLSDAAEHNPPWRGPNWKCGQEASIRVMHLAAAALMLGQVSRPEPGLPALLAVHLKRIAPTLHYAMAQDNNHGTSEAAALFIGGSWLASLGLPGGERWARRGRYWLENRAERLIGADGSFSQYSVNYHRVMLDTLCLAECWRRQLAVAPFSSRFYERARAATGWLGNLVDPGNGDAPNLGANDGARLIPLTDSDYRDYRPTVQVASVLFAGARAYPDCPLADQALLWLDLPVPEPVRSWQHSALYADGGLAVARSGPAMAVLRFPNFRFRPAQSDLLHLDLWRGGENLLRDGGTYSYNPGQEDGDWQDYFPGVASHNSVQFDGREQMPRLGRFLFGAWPSVRNLDGPRADNGDQTLAAGYRDWQGAGHYRRVWLEVGRLKVEDRVDGFSREARLRWRLCPGDWQWRGDDLINGTLRIRVGADVPVRERCLVQGWESRYYSQKTPLPVLEVVLEEAGVFTTEFEFPT